MTINEMIKLHKDVLQGKEVICNEHDPLTFCIISSDGLNWLVDGQAISTIEYQKTKLNVILARCQLAKELLEYIGLSTENMFHEYELLYDSIDKMMLLRKESSSHITFIYMINGYVAIEQIHKQTNEISFHYFSFALKKIQHKVIIGMLSTKSIQIIRENKRPKTQNFYYDMLVEGMNSYSDMLKTAKEYENSDDNSAKKLEKINHLNQTAFLNRNII